MTGKEIRDSFLRFFQEKGHEIVPSSSLVPEMDPTLLFTNAGMVQFKKVFLGIEKRPYSRAASAQKCLRISGKHNDLEEVGRDTYHHTFFEMLGNWSFGDYYKREAIGWAWELLTRVWRLPKENLWATIFTTDDEAEECWRSVTDLDASRILRFGAEENFWEMGEAGPCGPCSEIHIDRGPGTCDKAHAAGHCCGVNGNCARFIELWNLVFIQYNRDADGGLKELPAKHVDTGMGLERIAAVLQRVGGNYDGDLLRGVITFVEGLSNRRYGAKEEWDVSFRVIADHARAASFMIADGIVPSNEGRGYVLRRLLRRAARRGRILGLEAPFLFRVSEAVAEIMGPAYPELRERHRAIADLIRGEEERFVETLGKGLALLGQEIQRMRQSGENLLSGDVAFRLYDTYGFPLDLTEDILRGEGLRVDQVGFEQCLQEQRKRGREARLTAGFDAILEKSSPREGECKFIGDRQYEWQSEVRQIFTAGQEKRRAVEGETIQVVTAETPFYPESGGQVGDRGIMETDRGDLVEVIDTQKRDSAIFHVGRVVRGAVGLGDRVMLRVDRPRREAARLNHSATHILHAVLREVLGTHVRQAGSSVAPDRLRFDFTYPGPMGEGLLERVEEEVNAHIRENAEVTTEEMLFAQALRRGALAFFGEKYGDRVRVVKIGDFSLELCGGTHVSRSGDIGLFKLRGESGVAAGVRRVEAVTGEGALEWVRRREHILREIGEVLKGPEDEVVEKLEKLLVQQREIEKRLSQLQSQVAGTHAENLIARARRVNGIPVVASRVDHLDDARLRELADRLRDKMGSGIIVLGAAKGDRAFLLAAVTKDLTARYPAGELIKKIAPLVGGGGGGRADFAQAGGKDPTRLDEALDKVYEIVGGEA